MPKHKRPLPFNFNTHHYQPIPFQMFHFIISKRVIRIPTAHSCWLRKPFTALSVQRADTKALSATLIGRINYWIESIIIISLHQWMTESLTNWLTGSLTNALNHWHMDWLPCWITDSLNNCLTDSKTHKLTDSLIQWLTDLLNHFLNH